jgi:hypothetical protein
VGAGLFLAWFLAPAVRAAGPDGGKVMMKLQSSTGWSKMISAAAGLTVLSGILLYVRNTLAAGPGWTGSGPGIGFALGGLAGIAGAIHGGAVVGRLSQAVAQRGEALQAAGRPPTPEELAEFGALQQKLDQASRTSAILLTIAILLMAVSRYLVF